MPHGTLSYWGAAPKRGRRPRAVRSTKELSAPQITILLVGEHAPPHPLGLLRRNGPRGPFLERYRSNFQPQGVRSEATDTCRVDKLVPPRGVNDVAKCASILLIRGGVPPITRDYYVVPSIGARGRATL